MFKGSLLVVVLAAVTLMFSAIVAMGEMASHHEPIHDHHVIHSINNNPKSSWKAKVYEKFANMTVGEFKQVCFHQFILSS